MSDDLVQEKLRLERDKLRAALQAILDDALYCVKYDEPGAELRGYLQTVRGHARSALEEDARATPPALGTTSASAVRSDLVLALRKIAEALQEIARAIARMEKP